MSQKKDFLKNTLELIENDAEVKSYIYQQIMDFNPFATPETLVMVIARDPQGDYSSQNPSLKVELDETTKKSLRSATFRIAIVLKDGDTSIESEAYDNDIFSAIRSAKEILVDRLIEIQNEVENSQDRIKAIKNASDNKPIH
jgi:ribosome-associated translation inhibitor RaiA